MFINDKTLPKYTCFCDVPEGQTFKLDLCEPYVYLRIERIMARPYWKTEDAEYSALCLQTCELVELDNSRMVYWVKTRTTVDLVLYDEN